MKKQTETKLAKHTRVAQLIKFKPGSDPKIHPKYEVCGGNRQVLQCVLATGVQKTQ